MLGYQVSETTVLLYVLLVSVRARLPLNTNVCCWQTPVTCTASRKADLQVLGPDGKHGLFQLFSGVTVGTEHS